MLRKQGHDLTIVGAFWGDDAKTATRIANKANEASNGVSLTEAEATASIRAVASDLKIHLTEHAAVIQRIESAATHIELMLEQARKGGELQWFNQAFRDFRLRAKACGRPPMSYGQVRARLRQIIVRRALSGKRSEFGAKISSDIFPKLPE